MLLLLGAALLGWGSGEVLAVEGLLPVRYVGGLLAGGCAAAGAFLLLALFGVTDEDDALRVAVVAAAVAALVGIGSAGSSLLAEDPAAGSMIDAFVRHAERGVVHGAREGWAPNGEYSFPRRGGWVWVCWASQLVLLFLTTVMGTLAGMAWRTGASVEPEGRTEIVSDPAARGSASEPTAAVIDRRVREEVGDDPATLLVRGVERPRADWVREALEGGADPRASREDGTPLIVRAGVIGDLEVARLLLDAGADVDAIADDGSSPLHCAVRRGHHELVRFLLAQGATVDWQDEDGCTPFFEACRYGRVEAARALADARADIERCDARGQPPLVAAVREDRYEVVRLLLDRGASLEARNSAGWSPLHAAALSGRLDIATLLVRRGARLDSATQTGEQPIHAAAGNGHTGVVEMLIEAGVSPDARAGDDEDAGTPLSYAVGWRHPSTARALLRLGASVDYRARGGATLLMMAADASSLALVNLLLRKGLNRDARDESGLTAFDYADRCERPSPQAKKILKRLQVTRPRRRRDKGRGGAPAQAG